jgi:hypothetical protein
MKLDAVASSLPLLGGRALHSDALVRARQIRISVWCWYPLGGEAMENVSMRTLIGDKLPASPRF